MPGHDWRCGLPPVVLGTQGGGTSAERQPEEGGPPSGKRGTWDEDELVAADESLPPSPGALKRGPGLRAELKGLGVGGGFGASAADGRIVGSSSLGEGDVADELGVESGLGSPPIASGGGGRGRAALGGSARGFGGAALDSDTGSSTRCCCCCPLLVHADPSTLWRYS